MRLNITFERDANGRETAVITDDRGERLSGVRGVSVYYRYDDATIVELELVVNQTSVTLGAPAGEESE
jgi:hypothetical protein